MNNLLNVPLRNSILFGLIKASTAALSETKSCTAQRIKFAFLYLFTYFYIPYMLLEEILYIIRCMLESQGHNYKFWEFVSQAKVESPRSPGNRLQMKRIENT